MGEWWQTKFSVSPGPGLGSLVHGPFGPDLGPDQDLTWDLDLDLSLTIVNETDNESQQIKGIKEKKSASTTNGKEVISCKENMNKK